MNAAATLKSRDIVFYSASRYVGLGVLFIRGVLIAKFLGPELFGIWGFLTLFQQYLAYTSLGVQLSTTYELSNKSGQTDAEHESLISNALGASLIALLVLLVLGILVRFIEIPTFEKYRFDDFVFYIVCIAGLSHSVKVLISAYRAYGNVLRIAVVQLIEALLPLSVLFLFEGEILFHALMISIALTQVVGLIIFSVKPPFKIRLSFEMRMISLLVSIGFPLLIYDASFQLITISARTILSVAYPLEDMGYYSLANSLANAILLGLKSVVFLLLPSIIYQTRDEVSDAVAFESAERVTILFGTSVFLLVFVAITFLPLLFLVIPKFQPAESTICALLLSQAVLMACFGYNTAALSRGHQLAVAKIAFISSLVVISLSVVFAYFQLQLFWIGFSVLVGAVIFTLLQTRFSVKMLSGGLESTKYFLAVLSPGTILAVAVVITGCLMNQTMLAGILGLVAYTILNWQNVKALMFFSYQKAIG